MSSQSLPRPKKSASRARKKANTPATRRPAARAPRWIAWWPLLAGIAITLAAVKTAEVLPLMGAGGLRKLQLLYPFPLLLKQPQLGLGEATSDTWSQMMLYAQWILYGLYASLAVRWTSRRQALLHIAVVHFAGFGVLWWLSLK